MKIKTISVEALFGVYNHTIDMSGNSISIILGDNGLGKTTIFRMVAAFFKKDYHELLKEEYKLMRIVFDNDTIITFSPEISNNRKNLKITVKEAAEEEEKTASLNDMLLAREKLKRLVSKRIQSYSYYQVDNRQFPEYILKEEMLEDAFIEGIIGDLTVKEKKSLVVPKKLEEIQDNSNVIFVKAQRILTPVDNKNKRFTSGNTVYRETLEIYSEELKERINATKAEANDKSIEIDGSFTIRLLESLDSNEKPTPVKVGVLNKKLSDIYERQKALSELNLIRSDIAKPMRLKKSDSLNDSVSSIIEIYITDMNEKLRQYDSLYRKLRLFVDLANGYMSDKSLGIDSVGEMTISFKNKANKPIPLSSLSSGEQNLLVLLYNLIFIAKENSIVLLDEPEISLHVVWQRRFIDDLLRIIEINPLQICLATHSPSIIATHWHLTQEITNELEA